jgi:hypothetical protein
VVDVDYNDFDPAAGAERKERSGIQPDKMSFKKGRVTCFRKTGLKHLICESVYPMMYKQTHQKEMKKATCRLFHRMPLNA